MKNKYNKYYTKATKRNLQKIVGMGESAILRLMLEKNNLEAEYYIMVAEDFDLTKIDDRLTLRRLIRRSGLSISKKDIEKISYLINSCDYPFEDEINPKDYDDEEEFFEDFYYNLSYYLFESILFIKTKDGREFLLEFNDDVYDSGLLDVNVLYEE